MTQDLHDRVLAVLPEVRVALESLVRIRSVSADPARMDDVRRSAEAVAALARASGFIDVTISSAEGGMPAVVGRIPAPAGQPTVLLYAHHDVQPTGDPASWTSEPFEPVERVGRLFGRGAADDKAGVAAHLAAVRAFDGQPPVGVTLFVEGEEEIGSPHLGPWCADHPELLAADGMLCLDGGIVESAGVPEVALGLKAILYVELRAEGAADDVHSLNAAIVPSPAWRLVRALATLRADDGTILIPDWLDGYHAPTDADEALVGAEVARVDEATWRRELGIDAFPHDLDLTGAVRARRYQPTCNICGLTAGYGGPGTKTIIPARASAKLDFRLPPDLKPEIQLEKLRRHLDAAGFADIVIHHYGPGEWPIKTPPEAPVARAIARAAAHTFGKPPVVMGLSAEGTILRHVPMPLVLTGFSNADCNLHAPDENIVLDDYLRGIAYAATIYAEFASAAAE